MWGMPVGSIWMFAGVVLLVLEVLAPGVFMMWLGVAAIVTGGVIWQTGWEFGAQVGLFAVLATISLAIGMRFRPKAVPGLNTQLGGLVGRSAVALSFDGHEGRVRLGDSDWSARLASGSAIPEPGARLRVDGVGGTVLVVRPEG